MSEELDDFGTRTQLAHHVKPIYYAPNYVKKSDEEIVAWADVPEKYQKKILNGTMTDEDWVADWETKEKGPSSRDIEDVVSSLLNHPSMTTKPNHVHVWRKEYYTCMIKGCGAVNIKHLPPMSSDPL